LILEDGVMRVTQGPMENNHRPSIDVLFRSAAANFGAATCGILLSGTLDDGVAGLEAIRAAGGATFVQDPDDAQFPDMPQHAIAAGAVDASLPADRLFPALQEWLRKRPHPQSTTPPPDERQVGTPSVFTCPDCGGTLWELDEASVLRFRCRTGHAYSGHSMMAAQETRVEAALWAAMRALEERRDLFRRMARRSRQNGETASSRRFDRQAGEVEADIERVHAALASVTLRPGANPA
jgi:two-component system chemotaxis response regulator CheB